MSSNRPDGECGLTGFEDSDLPMSLRDIPVSFFHGGVKVETDKTSPTWFALITRPPPDQFEFLLLRVDPLVSHHGCSPTIARGGVSRPHRLHCSRGWSSLIAFLSQSNKNRKIAKLATARISSMLSR